MQRSLWTSLFVVCFGLGILSDEAIASPLLEDNSVLYIELSRDQRVFAPIETDAGEQILAPIIKLPTKTVIALDVIALSKVLSAQKSNPDSVNFPFVTSVDVGTQRAEMSKSGWYCGIRIVDVVDEELREDEAVNRDDLCMNLSGLSKATTLDTNGEAVREAFKSYINSNDLSSLTLLGNEFEIDAILGGQHHIGALGGKTPSPQSTIVSPIRNCGKGCLVVTSSYGMRKHPVLKKMKLHKGIDLRAKTGTPVVSTFPGKILLRRTEMNPKTKKMKGYGIYVIVAHPQLKMETLYAHLSAFRANPGVTVTAGQLIALSGNTGIGTAPHLHFETHVGTTPKDPRLYLGKYL